MSKIEVGIYYHENEDGNKVYDYEEMADEFEKELSMLDQNVVVMVSVEDKPERFTSGCGGMGKVETPTGGYAKMTGC
jgi:hypothetical protein